MSQSVFQAEPGPVQGFDTFAARIGALTGRRRLERMLRKGLPRWLVAPLDFVLTRRVGEAELPVLNRIEALRSEIARRPGEIPRVRYAGGPGTADTRTRPDQAFSPRVVGAARWPYFASTASVSPASGMFLHLVARERRPNTILELGSCVGISASYLATGYAEARLVSIEGIAALADVARESLRRVTARTEVVHATFVEGLAQVLPRLQEGIDLVYVDGHKKRDALLHYFATIRPHLNPQAAVVFDDIHWSSEMWKAWKEVRALPGFACTVNAGRFGIGVWQGGNSSGPTHDLFRIAGVDLFHLRSLAYRNAHPG